MYGGLPPRGYPRPASRPRRSLDTEHTATPGGTTICGRYVSVSTPEQLAEHFEVTEVKAEDQGQRFNVAPTLDVYAVIERDDERRLGTLRWGFLPFWAKQLKGAPSPINARLESVSDSKMFARAFEKRRCIIPADGFYEWKKREGTSRKQPYYFHSPDETPLAFAGIWSVWRDPQAGDDAEPVFSCAIVTTQAAGPIADVHDRMPLVLPRTLWKDWLSATPEEAPHLLDTVSALGAPAITARTITDRVNNVRNEGADLLDAGTVPED